MFPLRDNLPTDRPPVVTIVLIALNAFVYFFLQPKSGIDFSGNSLNQSALFHYGAIPYELTNPGQHCDLVNSGTAVACGSHLPTDIPTWATVFTVISKVSCDWKVNPVLGARSTAMLCSARRYCRRR